jgi:hypothetical protein
VSNCKKQISKMIRDFEWWGKKLKHMKPSKCFDMINVESQAIAQNNFFISLTGLHKIKKIL